MDHFLFLSDALCLNLWTDEFFTAGFTISSSYMEIKLGWCGLTLQWATPDEVRS